VALTPTAVAGLLKQGFKGLVVEQGAGAQARFSDNDYKAAGAQIVDRATALKQDIVVKVRLLPHTSNWVFVAYQATTPWYLHAGHSDTHVYAACSRICRAMQQLHMIQPRRPGLPESVLLSNTAAARWLQPILRH
jgi:NAD(P) transhydrogenase